MSKQTQEVIKFREGRHVSGVKAQDVAAEIERIEKKNGSVTPENLVKENSSPSKLLYNYFEWDGTKAGEKYRLIQARYLLRSIVIEKPIEGTKETVSVNMMFSAPTEKGSAYFSLVKLASNSDIFNGALSRLSAQAGQIEKSVSELLLIAPKSKRETAKKLEKPVAEIKKISEKLGA